MPSGVVMVLGTQMSCFVYVPPVEREHEMAKMQRKRVAATVLGYLMVCLLL
jgi:hypothetical protein